jgi:uncharacterized repeat protein (TIGR01451 family)
MGLNKMLDKVTVAPFSRESKVIVFAALFTLLFGPLALSAPAEDCRAVFIRLDGPTAAKLGEIVRYRIRVRNEGNCQIKDALVTDFIPRESRYVSAQPVPTTEPKGDSEPRLPVPKVEWKGVPITSSEGGDSFEVKVAIIGTGGRVITNTACVEHAKLGRLCDTFDTYVRVPLIEESDAELN